ncbi:MAG: tetratricopeptide repeat protein [Anaerolineae bacterium]
MSHTKNDTRNPMTFSRLMRLGQVAHAQGDDRAAHHYWQQAAMLEPANEQVWTALMWVIDDDEDRKVCLRNILAINPDNTQAQAMLDELIGETQPQMRDLSALQITSSTRTGVDFVRVLVLGSVLGFGMSIIILLTQMLITQL